MREQPATLQSDENQIIIERRAKLKALREKGDAFPNTFMRENLSGDLQEQFENNDRDSMDLSPVVVKVAGRLMLKRVMGRGSFATIQDMSGSIDLFFTDSYPGKEGHREFRECDVGDIIGAEGVLFKTQDHELTVRVKRLHLLTKSLRPLPERATNRNDGDLICGDRPLDLILNEETRLRFVLRSRIIQAMRVYFLDRQYVEVETPMMHPTPVDVSPRLFVTYHNTLDMKLCLRNTSDLYFKQLLIGGFQQVFEINRDFHDDFVPTLHNPEFTMLRLCTAYRNHYYLMRVIEKMILETARNALGTARISYRGGNIDFEKPFMLCTVDNAIMHYHSDLNEEAVNNRDALTKLLSAHDIAFLPYDSVGALQFALFKNTVLPRLFEPTFVFHYPVEVSPLARRSNKDPHYTECFGLYFAGMKIANGYSGSNDPEDQATRFQEQKYQKDAGQFETAPGDAENIRALQYGLPPCASASLCIDRLVMIFTDSPAMRDVILFPGAYPE